MSRAARVVASLPLRRAARFAVEALERRTLLSFSVSFPGGATFAQRGDADASRSAGEESESAIAINPANPRNVVAFANDLGGGSNDKAWFSTDGGLTYAQSLITNPAGTSGIGDGSAAFDRAGNLYYCHLVSPGLGVAISKSTNGGQTWGSAVLITASGADKPWITTGANPADLSQDIVYVGYRRDVSEAGGTDTQIHCVRSVNGGATFVNDTIIADDSIAGIDFSTFPRPYVRNSDGRVFVVWDDETNRPGFSQIKLDSSGDGGVTWGTDVIVGTTVVTRGNPVRWEIPAQADREILTVPSIAIAQAGPFAGRLFVSYTISPLGRPNSDIRVAWSDNPTGAAGSWNDTVANDVTTNSQFHPWVETDPMSGVPYVSFFDCRNSATNITAERFMTASIDGGVTWLPNVKVSDAPSNQSAGNPNRDAGNNFGDYNANVAMFGMGFDSWPDNTNSTGNNPGGTADLDIYTDRVVLGGHVITVTGTAADDTYTVKMDSSGTFLQIWENTAPVGVPSFTMLEDAIDGIIFNLGAGQDVVNLERLDASMPVSINGQAGDDLFNIGGTAQLVSNIQSPVAIGGGPGSDTINFTDSINANDDVYNLSATTIASDNSNVVTYGSVETLNLLGGTGNNDVNVSGTAAGTGIFLDAGAGQDSYNINGTDPASPPVLVSGAGDDSIFIDFDGGAPAAARVQALTTRFDDIDIRHNGLLSLLSTPGQVLVATRILTSDNGTFDLASGSAIVDYTGGSPLASIGSQVASGYAGATWLGDGITSSTAASIAGRGVGYAEATDVFTTFPATFAGQSIDDTSVLLKYTFTGDADLTGGVDLFDFNRLAANFGTSPRRWSQGDFDFDADVDLLDFNALALNFGQSGLSPAARSLARTSAMPKTQRELRTLLDEVTGARASA